MVEENVFEVIDEGRLRDSGDIVPKPVPKPMTSGLTKEEIDRLQPKEKTKQKKIKKKFRFKGKKFVKSLVPRLKLKSPTKKIRVVLSPRKRVPSAISPVTRSLLSPTIFSSKITVNYATKKKPIRYLNKGRI